MFEDLTDHFEHSISVAVVSDTHGFLDPRIASQVAQCDVAVHLGDIGAQEVLDELSPKSDFVFAVTGNNDVPGKWISEDSGSLQAIPSCRVLKLPGGELAMEHGHEIRDTRRYHEILRAKHPQARAVAYGHTHIRTVDQSESPWVLNPGAAGRERTKGGPSLLILTAAAGRWSIGERVFEPLGR